MNASKAMVGHLQDITVHRRAKQRQQNSLADVRSGVTQDEDALSAQRHPADKRGIVKVIHQNRRQIFTTGGKEGHLCVTDAEDLSHVGVQRPGIAAEGSGQPLHATRGKIQNFRAGPMVGIVAATPHIQVGTFAVNDGFHRDLRGILGFCQFGESAGVVAVVMGKEPGRHHDPAIRPLVQRRQRLVDLFGILRTAAVKNKEAAVRQRKDQAHADIVAVGVAVV